MKQNLPIAVLNSPPLDPAALDCEDLPLAENLCYAPCGRESLRHVAASTACSDIKWGIPVVSGKLSLPAQVGRV